jgi:hypothetical protein
VRVIELHSDVSVARLHRRALALFVGTAAPSGTPPPAAVYVVAPRTVELGDDAAGLASMGAFVITNTSWWPHLSMEDPPWESTSLVSATDALSLALWRYVPAPHTP